MNTGQSSNGDRAVGITPRVSVVIPCYNNERFVVEAVQSALSQTHPNMEVIVVDDGSSDGSVAALAPVADRIVLHEGSNNGACAARNKGLELATGDYVKFLDADDLMFPDAVEQQVTAVAAHGLDDQTILFGDHVQVDSTKTELPRPDIYDKVPPRTITPLWWVVARSPMTCSPLHPVETVRAVGGFDPAVRRGQEFNLHLRQALAGYKFFYEPFPIYMRREHEGPRISKSGAVHFMHSLDGVQWLWNSLNEKLPGEVDENVRAAVARYPWTSGLYAIDDGKSGKEDWRLARTIHKTPAPIIPWKIRAVMDLFGTDVAEVVARHYRMTRLRFLSLLGREDTGRAEAPAQVGGAERAAR